MIYVGGVPFSTDSSSSSSKGNMILDALMEHPTLLGASDSFKAIPERQFSGAAESGSESFQRSKWVYVFQREYATVDPMLVDLVGTDEATTCVGLVIRNQKSGMTSVAHLDSPEVVDAGLTQMLSLLIDHNSHAVLDVHLIGAFVDVSHQDGNCETNSKSHRNMYDYSFPLCAKIIEALGKSEESFHIQTLHVLERNTRWDSEGNAYPIFNGFLVETSTGSLIPSSFDRTSRCPDEIVRRIRVTASFEDDSWAGRLLETYDTRSDHFVIASCSWTIRQLHIAMALQRFPDTKILLRCSTSPSAEGPDFVDNLKRQWDYMIQHPDWRETFPSKQPRVFARTEDGGWTRLLEV